MKKSKSAVKRRRRTPLELKIAKIQAKARKTPRNLTPGANNISNSEVNTDYIAKMFQPDDLLYFELSHVSSDLESLFVMKKDFDAKFEEAIGALSGLVKRATENHTPLSTEEAETVAIFLEGGDGLEEDGSIESIN